MSNIQNQGPQRRVDIPKNWAKQGSQIKPYSILEKIASWIQKLGVKIRSLFLRKVTQMPNRKSTPEFDKVDQIPSANNAPKLSNISLEKEKAGLFKEGKNFAFKLDGDSPKIHLKIKQYKDLKSVPHIMLLNDLTKENLNKALLNKRNQPPHQVITIQLNENEVEKIRNAISKKNRTLKI